MGISTSIGVMQAYALLLAIGGIIGYRKAGSRASLYAGLGCGTVAEAATISMRFSPLWGLLLGLLLAIGLTAMFSYRYLVKTRKFMPSGMLAVASVVVGVVMAASLLGGSR